ncbi:hypothetical protein CRYUN_Cryun21dG0125800 [Craigia yunnanensis]
MNDGDVSRQIQQMVRFIRQEVEEKANEIFVSVEEEFNIEKLEIVEAKRRKIKQEYEQKGNARKELLRVLNGKRGYKNLIKALVVESLVRLKESAVLLRCREVDRKVVESILEEAKREYADKIKVATPKITIDNVYLPLPPPTKEENSHQPYW